MLLRIINKSVPSDTEYAIEIILEYFDKVEGFITEPYISPISDNFRKTITDYFKNYPKCILQNDKYLETANKLIKVGQYIGDKLLGEDLNLIKLKECIEKNGYENLQVQIESTRIEFFTEFWEAVILHESKYILSAVVKGYVRQFSGEDFCHHYPELRYDLKAASVVPDKITTLLQGDQAIKSAGRNKDHEPLRILHLVSRPESVDLPFTSSNSMNIGFALVSDHCVIDYEIYQPTSWKCLQDRLTDKTQPVHILHYDGPVILDNNGASIALTHLDSQLNIDELCKMLVAGKVAVLSVDARAYWQNKQTISAAVGLATIAKSAHKYGLGNVIGMGEVTNPWTSGLCFQTIYSQIIMGFSLEQAVVEARKVLQTTIEDASMTLNPIPFHTWPLLIHYSKQSVIFFESAQTSGDAATSHQELKRFHNKLFGFQSRMLPPMLDQVGDGQLLQLINQLLVFQQSGLNQAILITGESGAGKTQLAHITSLYLALRQQINYGFYFDFANDQYSSSDMLEMIAPVLEIELNDRKKVENRLAKLHCCFVLDNFLSSEDRQSKVFEQSRLTVVQLVKKLISNGHIVLITGQSGFTLDELDIVEIEMMPLPFIEQKRIAINSLHELSLPEETLVKIEKADDLDDLLPVINGNPWLAGKLMPLLAINDIVQLKSEIEQNIDKKAATKIEQFYEWRWKTLKPVWQKLLILCADVPGLLLEMLMLAFDSKQSFPPTKALFLLIGEEDAKYAECLEAWEYSGFISRFPHGRMIDSSCLEFVQKKREHYLNDVDREKLQFYFSQLICKGIQLLAQHVVKQPNPNISNNLLLNRRNWVKYFESLWCNQDYRGFMTVKHAFDQLLQQVNLEGESEAWSLDLLERYPITRMIEEVDIEEKLCWLALASSALDEVTATNSETILTAIEMWRGWFNSLTETVCKDQLALFYQVAMFLEKFYQKQTAWNDCVIICEKAYIVYMQYEIWQKVILSLRSLAEYHTELGEKNQALIYEDKIINDIPYIDAPPGLQTRQILDIILARLSRTDTQQAKMLLQRLKKTDQSESLIDICDDIQCEIYYQEENYIDALPYYCKAWKRTLQSSQPAQIEQLKLRLVELEKQLGQEYFNEYFERELPREIIKPKDYVSVLH